MRISNIFRAAIVALTASFAIASGANAALVHFPNTAMGAPANGSFPGNDGESINGVGGISGTTFLGKINIGDDDPEDDERAGTVAQGMGTVDVVLKDGAVAPIEDFFTLSFDVGTLQSGSVSYDLTGAGFELTHVVLKGGPNFAIFTLMAGMSGVVGSFDWVLAGFLLNNGGNVPDLSHITFYGRPVDTSVVPLPAALWMMIAGLGGLGAMSRKKKA